MIFFYRVNTLNLGSVELNEEVCPHCTKKGGLVMHFRQRYLSALLPIIPAGRYAEIECVQCNTVFLFKKGPSSIKAFYKQEKNKFKTPVRLWSGMFLLLIFLVLLIGYGAYQAVSANKKTVSQNALLASLKAGDILRTLAIEKNVSASVPTFYIISGIAGDTAFLKRYNQNWPLTDFKQWEKVIPDIASFSKTELPFSLQAIKQQKKLISLSDNTEKYKNSSGNILEVIAGK